MFGFLKDKLKGVMKSFSKKVEEDAPEEKTEVVKEEPKKVSKKEVKKETPKKEVKKEIKKETKEEKEEVVKEVPKVQEPKVEEKIIEPVVEKVVEELTVEEKVEPKVEEKKGFFSKLFKKEEKVEEKVEVKTEEPEQKKGFFGKFTEVITTKKISADKFDELFWDLELALLENNVALEVIEKIKSDLKSELVDKPIPRGKVDEVIASSLHDSIEGLFNVGTFNILDKIKEKKPYVICFIGINGSGKTTSIAKVANYLQSQGLSVVMAAADTFRAAAIDQLQLHADKLGIKLIRHDYGSDPAAVAFDAVKHAEAKKVDVVLVDTAGRLHSNINLMDEMKKIIRVAKPDLKIFVGESITGNDCVEQAKQFNDAVGVDGIILSKADVDEKGGAAISVSYVTQRPILFLGVGQEYKDLQPFDKEKLLASIGL
jgi:fused signal recognition particle receptor